jgi:hypothetical protein
VDGALGAATGRVSQTCPECGAECGARVFCPECDAFLGRRGAAPDGTSAIDFASVQRLLTAADPDPTPDTAMSGTVMADTATPDTVMPGTVMPGTVTPDPVPPLAAPSESAMPYAANRVSAPFEPVPSGEGDEPPDAAAHGRDLPPTNDPAGGGAPAGSVPDHLRASYGIQAVLAGPVAPAATAGPPPAVGVAQPPPARPAAVTVTADARPGPDLEPRHPTRREVPDQQVTAPAASGPDPEPFAPPRPGGACLTCQGPGPLDAVGQCATCQIHSRVNATVPLSRPTWHQAQGSPADSRASMLSAPFVPATGRYARKAARAAARSAALADTPATSEGGDGRRRPALPTEWLVLVAAVVAGFLIVGLVMALRGTQSAPVQVNASSWSSSSAAPGHPATLAGDGYSNTWWAPLSGHWQGSYLQADFGTPVDLADVLISNGASTTADGFASQARPSLVELTATDESGASTTRRVTLPDSPGTRTIALKAADVVSVRLTVLARSGPADGAVAVGEVQFFAARSASS